MNEAATDEDGEVGGDVFTSDDVAAAAVVVGVLVNSMRARCATDGVLLIALNAQADDDDAAGVAGCEAGEATGEERTEGES